VNELEIAEIQTKLDNLGLQSGVSKVSQARMVRVSQKAQKLQKITTDEQFRLLSSVIRMHKGDIEPLLDSLILEIELGTFVMPPDPVQPTQAQIKPLANRRERRRKRR
jgi:hypothetical protein